MQDFALAGLPPKLRQIAVICKKPGKHNEMGYLKYVLKFGLMSKVLVLEVKVYGQALFFKY